MPYKNGNMPPNATIWTQEMLDYLKNNYQHKTNAELARYLGLKKTICRMKLYELGFKRMVMEYWSQEQIQFLKNNYKSMGDVEMMEIFKKRWPKNKGWKRSAIHKKRKQLGLFRTAEEIHKLASRNSSKGGRSFTIDKNSSSKNMHPLWVAQQLAWRNPEMQIELTKHPEIIEVGRSLILLKRTIKQQKQKIGKSF